MIVFSYSKAGRRLFNLQVLTYATKSSIILVYAALPLSSRQTHQLHDGLQ